MSEDNVEPTVAPEAEVATETEAATATEAAEAAPVAETEPVEPTVAPVPGAIIKEFALNGINYKRVVQEDGSTLDVRA